MREINNSVDTVNAAASAIISADSRVQQVTVPRKRWAGFLRVYWCFGSQKNGKRMNHAALVPEPTPEASSTSQNSNLTQTLTLAFIAPPSSPASFLTSEPHSSTQSPGGFLSHSPTPRPSIFTIGPYANETQLVSPPVFSAFTTEPNTAPFTPPPESVQLTTPSSPEVPFAQLLSSSFDSNRNKRDEANEFNTYQWYPGSPIGQLISPSSVPSGTSSPFPDTELHSRKHGSIFSPSSIPSGTSSPFPDAELHSRKHGSIFSPSSVPSGTSSPFPDIELHSRKHGSILDGQIPAIVFPEPPSSSLIKNNNNNANNRVSFELTAEEVARALRSSYSDAELGHNGEAVIKEMFTDEPEQDDMIEKIESSGELNASKEFKFSNSEGVTAETVPPKNWAFFPTVHTETVAKMKMQI